MISVGSPNERPSDRGVSTNQTIPPKITQCPVQLMQKQEGRWCRRLARRRGLVERRHHPPELIEGGCIVPRVATSSELAWEASGSVVLAREDIDEAVHAILFRENYIVKTKASPLCECLFRRQQELREAKGTSYQQGTGKQNDTQKEPKGTGKASLFSRSPQFMLTSHAIVLKERQRASSQPGTCSSEKLVCASKSHLSQEEETPNLSQLASERQFHFWKLSQENKEAEKKGPVSCGLGVGLGGRCLQYPLHSAARPSARAKPGKVHPCREVKR
ncbi:family with sequence similarity 228 member A [Cricetulus griseus]